MQPFVPIGMRHPGLASGVNTELESRRGPGSPYVDLFPLDEHAARRTTTVDVSLPAHSRDVIAVRLKGQDLRGHARRHAVTASADVRLELDADSKEIRAVDGADAVADDLLGVAVGSGYRRRMTDWLDDSLLGSLLDQLPHVVFLVGYTQMLDAPPEGESPAAQERLVARRDGCAAYAPTATIPTWIVRYGHQPVPRGPVISPDHPSADWHTFPALPPLSLRRARLLDVCPSEGGVTVRSMFRDTNVDRNSQSTVLHEYTLRVDLDDAHRVVDVEATPRVLPWRECPAAASSADKLIGLAVSDLRSWVTPNLQGSTTCTHLNEAFRALADTDYLLSTIVPA